ncbi:MAG: glycosyltransferase [Pirellulaceae bacterium]|nr:glycosyltransferase [Pirellulaceae bacterium]
MTTFSESSESDSAADESPEVTLVIPGRNCQATVRQCLESVVPLLERGELKEIIFVDDGSTDNTARVVAEYPVRCVQESGRGRGAARNVGWRMSDTPLIWFIDSDCVAEPDALQKLLVHTADPHVAGVGGSYGNMRPDSLLASLIHEEIVERHRRMPPKVDYLATFNVLYRRDVLEKVGGFDESYLRGQDVELAYRILATGQQLAFTIESRVGHYHPTRLFRYLRTQGRHGYFRVKLYLRHPSRVRGDAYSGWVDYVQPPLAVLGLATIPLLCYPSFSIVPLILFAMLIVFQLPMTFQIIHHSRRWTMLTFVPLGFTRAVYRGFGMTTGLGGLALEASMAIIKSCWKRTERLS